MLEIFAQPTKINKKKRQSQTNKRTLGSLTFYHRKNKKNKDVGKRKRNEKGKERKKERKEKKKGKKKERKEKRKT